MICLLFIPATIQIVHAIEPHHHIVCSSDVEHHFHTDELECTLCHLQAESFGLIPHQSYKVQLRFSQEELNKQYIFYKDHQHLSYSLRGPPSFNLSQVL